MDVHQLKNRFKNFFKKTGIEFLYTKYDNTLKIELTIPDTYNWQTLRTKMRDLQFEVDKLIDQNIKRLEITIPEYFKYTKELIDFLMKRYDLDKTDFGFSYKTRLYDYTFDIKLEKERKP